MIIDSHAHLDYPQLADDLPAVLARAHEAGVDRVITIGVKLTTVDRPRALAEANDNIWFSAGVHPHEAGNEADACNVDAFLSAADHPRCVAIGEAGLDYHYDYAPRDRQAESFRAQITAARELDLPMRAIIGRDGRILPDAPDGVDAEAVNAMKSAGAQLGEAPEGPIGEPGSGGQGGATSRNFGRA